MSAATMAAPTGVEKTSDNINPTDAETTDKTAEKITTARKLLKIRMALNAGKTISAVTSKEPTSFIPSTITTAETTAIAVLYTPERIPVAEAKSSSKVTANILL